MRQEILSYTHGSETKIKGELERAKIEDRTVRVRYENNGGVVSERTLDPLHLYHRYGKWYLIAYCRLRKEKRTFVLQRMELLSIGPASTPAPARAPVPTYASAPTPTSNPAPAPSLDSTPSSGSHTGREVPASTASRPHQSKERGKSSPSLLGALFWAVLIIVVFTNLFPRLEEWSGSRRRPAPAPDEGERISLSDQEYSETQPDPPRKKWTYRGYTLVRSSTGMVNVTELDMQARSGRTLHYLINSVHFVEETGIDDGALLKRYAEADRDGNGHLSWPEVSEFQRKTARSFHYRHNNVALPPDEFLSRGGGDCEDFAIYTCGMLRFWGWNCKVAGYYPPEGGVGHAITLVWSSRPIEGYGYFKYGEGSYARGDKVRPGYWIPIDYEAVGGITDAMEENWRLWELSDSETLYWRKM